MRQFVDAEESVMRCDPQEVPDSVVVPALRPVREFVKTSFKSRRRGKVVRVKSTCNPGLSCKEGQEEGEGNVQCSVRMK